MPGNLEPGSNLGSYRIEKLLGKGGMGEVYLAEDTRLKRKVALKVLPSDVSNDETYLKRFHREAESAASLHHSNICTIFEIGESDGQTFIAMEYCEGITLQQRLAQGPMELDEVLDIGIQIADALEEARKKKIVHRDIKSSNILLSDRKQVKVLDFGLAKQIISPHQDLSEASTAAKLTESGVVVGTVAYMSPEQALGKQVDHRTDIYSFGVVLYEMLTGRLPFSGNSTPELLDAILHKEPPSIARYNEKIPDQLMRIVGKMLRKDPEERYQSVHDVWVDLRQLKRESTSQSAIGAAKSVSMSAKLRYSAFGIGVAIIAIIAAVFFLIPGKQTAPPPQMPSEITNLVALPSKVYGSQDVAYLTDAVPSTISTLLGEMDGFDMKVPPTSLEVEKVNGDLKRIAEAYGVSTLLLSSVTAQQDQLIIDVQLVEAHGRSVLWSKQFEGTQSNYIELTHRAANGIRGIIRPESPALIAKAEGASNSEAKLAFQQGKFFSNRYNNRHNAEDFDKAYAAFQRALQLDPKKADAAAEIAMLYEFQLEGGAPVEETLPLLEKWATKALSINRKTSTAWTALCAFEGWQTKRNAKVFFENAVRAVQADTRNAMAYVSLGFAFEGFSSSSALRIVMEGHQVDPLYLYPLYNAAAYLFLLGRPQEALRQVEQALDLEEDFPVGLWMKFLLFTEMDRLDEAEGLFQKLTQHALEEKIHPDQYAIADYLHAVTTSKASTIRDKLVHTVNDPNIGYFPKFWSLFAVPSAIRTGDTDLALTILERAAEADAVAYDQLILNRFFDPLRSDSRFLVVVERSRNHFETGLQWIEDARSRNEFPEFLEKPLADHLKELGYEQSAAGSL